MKHIKVDYNDKQEYQKTKQLFDIEELKGNSLNNAIKNMQLQLLEDNNEIEKLEDITLERIFAEIDSVGILFSASGEIILN